MWLFVINLLLDRWQGSASPCQVLSHPSCRYFGDNGAAGRLRNWRDRPLVGADLLHLRDIEVSEIGFVSIGGAGTFDGIVLSGIVAAYLT